jgi:hypothetical protein
MQAFQFIFLFITFENWSHELFLGQPGHPAQLIENLNQYHVNLKSWTILLNFPNDKS